ncbi:putative tetratricopeptide-like helical domain superfamily, cns1/TTC4, wheel [Helianthus annuus]|nr:putative tetratricopeptide-like helical domain superfamily, cns1/TTC4, wheel [Helianthus annuus]KAJ0695536.1 putative tetratricopeptide-like helical domain superfamily, cns1/TTC4, wheel [Helianthus annuus]
MALLMEKGAEPQTERELADLDAISALKESAAIELKEEGNKYVKMGKKHYQQAINCYTRAINQKALSDTETSILHSNRAHVNLLLGNYGRALSDSEEAIKLSPTNIKAYYRAAKASLSVNKLVEAKAFSEKGLDQDPDNEELKKLKKQIDSQISELQQREAQVSKALKTAKDIMSAIEDRGIKIGKATFQELTGLKKPILDNDHMLHWPVLLLYAEVMSSDFIEDFCETDMFSAHLDLMFSDSAEPLPWDKENAYTRDAIELYYEAGSGVCLSKKEILSNLLQGTAASHIESFGDEDTDAAKSSPKEISSVGNNRSKWVKVNERKTLHAVLKEPNFIIPGIPVFFVVSKKSSFYKDFKSGNWSLPS